MATEIWLERRMGHLVPANSQSAEVLQSLPSNKWMLASIRNPRNLKHHRKFMAILQAVFPHQDMWPTFNSFRKAFTVALGYGEIVKSRDGREIMDAESISFASMDQTEFEQFYEKAINLIMTRIIPNVNRADLEREIGEIFEGRKAAA